MKITNDILKDYFYDKCSHEEEIEIQKWLTENDNSLVDQSFREIISEIQMENHELSQKAFEKFQKATQPQQVRTPRPGLQRSIRWMQRVAAVLFIPLLFLAGYLLLDKKANTHWNDITVPHGMHQTLTLSDGTTLHVNSGTRVIYPSDFTENKREIFVSGELFADVAKDPDKPFIISAGDVHVQVLGTKFNLRAYENIETVEVALVEGSVLFKTPTHPNEILKKGEMIQYNRTSQKIVRDTFLANLYKCPAKNEGFYFSNLPLNDIVKELVYYFDTRIIILDQKLSDNTYIAYFTNGETLDEILSNLNTDGQMSITRSQGVILITSAAP